MILSKSHEKSYAVKDAVMSPSNGSLRVVPECLYVFGTLAHNANTECEF